MYHNRPQWSERSAMTHKSIILTPAPHQMRVGTPQKQLVIQAPSADLNQSIHRLGPNAHCHIDWVMPLNHPRKNWRKRHRLMRPFELISLNTLLLQGIQPKVPSNSTHTNWGIVCDDQGHTHRVVYIFEEHMSQFIHYGCWDTTQSILTQ